MDHHVAAAGAGVLSVLGSVLLCPFQITPLLVIDLATNKTSDQADHCKGSIGERIYIFLYLIFISVSCSYYFYYYYYIMS